MNDHKLSIVLPAYKCKPDIRLLQLLFPQAEIIVARDVNGCGKGATLKKGCERATGDYIVWLDGDMEILPEQVYDFVGREEDIVIASKLLPESKVEYSIKRWICSLGYYIFIKILFNLPVHDTQTGLKVFKRKALDTLLPLCESDGFTIDIEILAYAHRLGYSIKELPVIVESIKKDGSIHLKTIKDMIWHTLKIRWKLFNFKRKSSHLR